MRLSSDVLQEIVDSLKGERLGRDFRIGEQPAAVNMPPGAVLAPRAKVRPSSDAGRHRAWTVAVRSATASGVVFVDGHYWMDGEHFILRLPKPTIPAMLCAITHWQPVASDLFVVSARFVRPLHELPECIPPRDKKQRHANGF